MTLKLDDRIAIILSVISVMTIVLVTALMHFRYHITRLDLIEQRLNVVTRNVARTITNSMKLGIPVEELKNTQALIKRARTQEKILFNVDVVLLKNDKAKQLYTDHSILDNTTLNTIAAKIRTSKTQEWRFENQQEVGHVGITLLNLAGVEIGAVLACYPMVYIKQQEKQEIHNLYFRMIVGILISLILSVLIAKNRTHNLTNLVNIMDSSLTKLEKGENKFDLSGINDPIVRGNFRNMINFYLGVKKRIEEIDSIVSSSGSHRRKEKKNDDARE